MDNTTWFLIGMALGIYRKEVYILIKKEYDKTNKPKEIK